jgi:hypothetical protein
MIILKRNLLRNLPPKKIPRLKVSGFFISYVLTLGTPRVSDRHETPRGGGWIPPPLEIFP